MTEPKGLGKSLKAFEGKGLEAFFSNQKVSSRENSIQTVPIEKITVNRQQPRKEFNEETLKELAESIRKEGVLQPLVVSPLSDGRYELIAGERRLRASRLAGAEEVPVVIRNADQEKMLELALVENIQREDLNAIEEAIGYQSLADRFQLTQVDIAERVGKSREHVANTLRLLKLPKLIQEDVASGRITSGHARALLALPTLQDQLNYRERIFRETLTVRDIEAMIQNRQGGKKKRVSMGSSRGLSPQMRALQDEMQRVLGTRVQFQTTNKIGRGKIVIDFFSFTDLDRIVKRVAS